MRIRMSCVNLISQTVELEYLKQNLLNEGATQFHDIGWRANGTLAEDALNATKAAAEGIVGVGGTLLRLASKVDSIIESLENDKQQVGTEIARKTLNYPFEFIVNKMSSSISLALRRLLPGNLKYGYNAGKYEYLMAAGIIVAPLSSKI